MENNRNDHRGVKNTMQYRIIFLFFIFILWENSSQAAAEGSSLIPNSCDSIMVSKSSRKMYLYSKRLLLKCYEISIGYNPIGHKQQQGDNRTPEGVYTITSKNPNSAYFKNLGISYPNQQDRLSAKRRRVSTGGDIKIHGYSDNHGSTQDWNTRYAYTWGCIGVCNRDMDEIFKLVRTGAKIFIQP